MDLEQVVASQSLKTHYPKHVGQGLGSGMNCVVQGAMDAAGIAVLTPRVHAHKASRRQNNKNELGDDATCDCNVIHGTVAGMGGIVMGSGKAVNAAFGGIVDGACQVVRGVLATPAAIIQPHRGKWFNADKGQWTATNLKQEALHLQHVPQDDSDLIPFNSTRSKAETHQVQNDNTTLLGLNGRSVKNPYLYDVLEVPCNADTRAIKRQYHLLARHYSPERAGNKNSPNAMKKFEMIRKARDILTSDTLRQDYDLEGWEDSMKEVNIMEDEAEILVQDETMQNCAHGSNSVTTSQKNNDIDPNALYSMLYGSNMFHPYIGRLSAATSALFVGDQDDRNGDLSVEDAVKVLQQRRVTRLALELVQNLASWVTGDEMVAKQTWSTQTIELASASYGRELLFVLGNMYILSAIEFLGSFDSGIAVPSVSEWIQAQWATLKRHHRRSQLGMRQRRMSIQATMVVDEISRQMKHNSDSQQNDEIYHDIQRTMIVPVLQILWTMTVVDITSTIHEAIQMVLFDQSVCKDTRKLRAQGLQELGRVFARASTMEQDHDNSNQIDTTTASRQERVTQEEIAFQAMLETIVRKNNEQQKRHSDDTK